MPNGAKRYVFTLNNYTADEVQLLSGLYPATASYVVFGREVAPGTGTPHLQGYICFNQRKSINFVRQLLPRAHIEIARGSPTQCRDYSIKDGDYDEFGTLPNAAGHRSDWDDYRKWCSELDHRPDQREIMDFWPAIWGRYSRSAVAMANEYCPKPKLREGDTNEWQTALELLLEEPAEDRMVRFYVDTVGGSGKSWFCGYLYTKRDDVQLLGPGKRDDIAHMIELGKRIFLFNIPRGSMEFLNYGLLEMLKDRMIVSPKYESTMKILDYVPHVVVFSNEHPDETKMSADRYDINILNN